MLYEIDPCSVACYSQYSRVENIHAQILQMRRILRTNELAKLARPT